MENIFCKLHLEPITFLDISPKIPRGVRVKCLSCIPTDTDQSNLVKLEEAKKMFNEIRQKNSNVINERISQILPQLDQLNAIKGNFQKQLLKIAFIFESLQTHLVQTLENQKNNQFMKSDWLNDHFQEGTISYFEEMAFQISLNSTEQVQQQLDYLEANLLASSKNFMEDLQTNIQSIRAMQFETQLFLTQLGKNYSNTNLEIFPEKLTAQIHKFDLSFDKQIQKTINDDPHYQFDQSLNYCKKHQKPLIFFNFQKRNLDRLLCEDCCGCEQFLNLDQVYSIMKQGKNYLNKLSQSANQSIEILKYQFCKTSLKLQNMQSILQKGIVHINQIWSHYDQQLKDAEYLLQKQNYELFAQKYANYFQPQNENEIISSSVFIEEYQKQYNENWALTLNILALSNNSYDKMVKTQYVNHEIINDIVNSKFLDIQVDKARRCIFNVENKNIIEKLIFDRMGRYFICQTLNQINCFSLRKNKIQFNLVSENIIFAFCIQPNFENFAYVTKSSNYLKEFELTFCIIKREEQDQITYQMQRKIFIEEQITSIEMGLDGNVLFILQKQKFQIWQKQKQWVNIKTIQIEQKFLEAIFNSNFKMLALRIEKSLDQLYIYSLKNLHTTDSDIKLKIHSPLLKKAQKMKFFNEEELQDQNQDRKQLLLCFRKKKIIILQLDLEKKYLLQFQILDVLNGTIYFFLLNNYLILQHLKNTCLYLYKLEQLNDLSRKLYLKKITCFFSRFSILNSSLSPLGQVLAIVEKEDSVFSQIKIYSVKHLPQYSSLPSILQNV